MINLTANEIDLAATTMMLFCVTVWMLFMLLSERRLNKILMGLTVIQEQLIEELYGVSDLLVAQNIELKSNQPGEVED